MKTSEYLWFSNVFRKDQKGAVERNVLSTCSVDMNFFPERQLNQLEIEEKHLFD